MALPDREQFKAAINQTIQEAEGIIESVKANPDLYIGKELANFLEENLTYFLEQFTEASLAIQQDWPDAVLPAIDPNISSVEATGSADNAEAATRQLDYVKDALSDQRIDSHYNLYEGKTKQTMTTALAENVFSITFKLALESFYTLYNTMRKKMKQGKPPKLVAGPGQKIKKTLFGEILINDTPNEDVYIGSITVSQLRAVIREELGR